jgi:hypothetical protein
MRTSPQSSDLPSLAENTPADSSQQDWTCYGSRNPSYRKIRDDKVKGEQAPPSWKMLGDAVDCPRPDRRRYLLKKARTLQGYNAAILTANLKIWCKNRYMKPSLALVTRNSREPRKCDYDSRLQTSYCDECGLGYISLETVAKWRKGNPLHLSLPTSHRVILSSISRIGLFIPFQLIRPCAKDMSCVNLMLMHSKFDHVRSLSSFSGVRL